MALITCPECNREVSSSANVCPHCGYVINNNKILIVGYQESFALNPSVDIYKGSEKIANVGHGAQIEIEVDEPCLLVFKASFRSAQCFVTPGETEVVILSFNRTTGSLSATCSKKDCYKDEIIASQKKDGNRLIVTLVICAVMIFLGYMISCTNSQSNSGVGVSSDRSNPSAYTQAETSSKQVETFHSSMDVINYMSSHRFRSGDMTLSVESGYLYANGQCLTGALQVEDFDETTATVIGYSPFNNASMRLVVASVRDLYNGQYGSGCIIDVNDPNTVYEEISRN